MNIWEFIEHDASMDQNIRFYLDAVAEENAEKLDILIENYGTSYGYNAPGYYSQAQGSYVPFKAYGDDDEDGIGAQVKKWGKRALVGAGLLYAGAKGNKPILTVAKGVKDYANKKSDELASKLKESNDLASLLASGASPDQYLQFLSETYYPNLNHVNSQGQLHPEVTGMQPHATMEHPLAKLFGQFELMKGQTEPCSDCDDEEDVATDDNAMDSDSDDQMDATDSEEDSAEVEPGADEDDQEDAMNGEDSEEEEEEDSKPDLMTQLKGAMVKKNPAIAQKNEQVTVPSLPSQNLNEMSALVRTGMQGKLDANAASGPLGMPIITEASAMTNERKAKPRTFAFRDELAGIDPSTIAKGLVVASIPEKIEQRVSQPVQTLVERSADEMEFYSVNEEELDVTASSGMVDFASLPGVNDELLAQLKGKFQSVN